MLIMQIVSASVVALCLVVYKSLTRER